jgi:hypothetical protein
LTYLERQKCYVPDKKILFKKQLFDLEVKSQGPTQNTTLWPCTHIPNIIDLSGKTKKIWSGQALLRRSRRSESRRSGSGRRGSGSKRRKKQKKWKKKSE